MPDQEETLTPDHPALIAAALGELLARKAPDGFVILEDLETAKFVQFTGSSADPLVLALPTHDLSVAEFQCASALFGEFGASVESFPEFDGPDGTVVGTRAAFHVNLNRDHAKAAAIAMRIFTEVYKLPADFRLHIEES